LYNPPTNDILFRVLTIRMQSIIGLEVER
jgi:hypothetical protein